MICTNVDKCSAKIFFAVSMGYSACLFQVLIETFSRKLTNLLWSAMASFGPQSDFPKTFCSIFFSLVNGCLIQNALCSDVICSRIAIDGQPLKESLAVSICNKILFFSVIFCTSDLREITWYGIFGRCIFEALQGSTCTCSVSNCK